MAGNATVSKVIVVRLTVSRSCAMWWCTVRFGCKGPPIMLSSRLYRIRRKPLAIFILSVLYTTTQVLLWYVAQPFKVVYADWWWYALDVTYYYWFIFLVFQNHATCYFMWQNRKCAVTEKNLRIITLYKIPFEMILFTVTLLVYEHYVVLPPLIVFIYTGFITAVFRQLYVLRKSEKMRDVFHKI